MSLDSPLQNSRALLTAMGTQIFRYHEDRSPTDARVLVVSNHRSFMDAPLLMSAVGHSIRFASHHYIGQVPMLREIVTSLGAFPLEKASKRLQHFFDRANELLQAKQWVGVFPEGGQAMVKLTSPKEVGEFQRGFAHLALRSQLENLAVLPVAIASLEEQVFNGLPVRLLSIFDSEEPLFQRWDSHPVVIYKRVNVSIGRPYWITRSRRQAYQGKQAKAVVDDLIGQCRGEIADLLRQGCY